ncbi:glycosyltransferase family 2 protein [Flavobacterium psychrolimnae]|uniref:Galactosyltransferase C-terminal domain-containing protein n=1 Tax=Flavobacterium psychrolimnae TaxID=249351 RepID=A0A366AZZ2_9FLAO|nr:galactosyltransferase-related protein [Flavobacterium psychrolimnae]RBN50306.1 hypothetical protein DR980_09330 [Flavobacterium psychrolimnae]
MITLVFTYRNRSIHIVKRCLQSLKEQSNLNFQVVLVNYGSTTIYTQQIEKLLENFHFVTAINCEVSKQLWNKSKAINIALKKCETSHFFVGDIDMIFRNDFIEKLNWLKSDNEAIYFQVGFLSESESKLDKSFDNYKIKHKTNEEATGMTLYPTKLLKKISGYDEFYHGWGAEDTDVHCRLRNAGIKVNFFDKTILLLHQWHPRSYRSMESIAPFHSSLEQINHQYIQKIVQNKMVLANTIFDWGLIPNSMDFTSNVIQSFQMTNQESEVNAMLYGLWDNYKGHYLIIDIKPHSEYKSVKNSIKKIIKKKHFVFYDFQSLNDLILIHLITRFRNQYYEYEWDKVINTIQLKIVL